VGVRYTAIRRETNIAVRSVGFYSSQFYHVRLCSSGQSVLSSMTCDMVQGKTQVIEVVPSTQRYYRRFIYCLLLLKLLHVSVVRPSSSSKYLPGFTRLTTDSLFSEYS
jgi:hypothetical protein